MRATDISRISGRKKLAEYLVALFRSKSVTFWVQLVGIQYWNVAITDKETILCQVIRTYQLFLSVLLSGKDWLTWLMGTNLNNTDFWTPAFRRKGVPWFDYCQYFFFFLIRILSMEGWTATTRHGVTRKSSMKKLKHTGNLFRKKPQLKDNSTLKATKIIDQRKAFYMQKIPVCSCARKNSCKRKKMFT